MGTAGGSAQQQVAFPVAWHRPVINLGRTLAIATMPTSQPRPSAERVRRPRSRSNRRWALSSSRNPPRPGRRSTRRWSGETPTIVGHADAAAATIPRSYPATSPTRAWQQPLVAAHHDARVELEPSSLLFASALGSLGGVASPTAVAGHLPGDRRRWPAQRPGDLSQRLTHSHPTADLRPLTKHQPRTRHPTPPPVITTADPLQSPVDAAPWIRWRLSSRSLVGTVDQLGLVQPDHCLGQRVVPVADRADRGHRTELSESFAVARKLN